MSYNLVPTGKNPPDNVNVIIEIPQGGEPVKYEVDKDSGALFVDRVLGTSMRYPCNYGYIPHTLCGDGDPADVLVVLDRPLIHGTVIACRPVGLLRMTDDGGQDSKILAVPVSKITSVYDHVKNYTDLPEILVRQVEHFFQHYKDLEKGKWVKIEGWADVEAARQEILDSISNYQNSAE